MNKFFIDNEYKTNRSLINVYWASIFSFYIAFIIEGAYNNVNIISTKILIVLLPPLIS